MLAKLARITTTDEYRSVFGDSRPVWGRLLSVRVRKTDGPARFGIIVSTKVSPLATTRNLVKRRLRAAIHDLQLDTHDGYEAVITAGPAAARADQATLRTELESLMGRAR